MPPARTPTARGQARLSPRSARHAIRVAEEHPDLAESIRFTKDCVLFSRSIAAALHYLCSRLDPEAANRFFDGLATGANIERGEPLQVLRMRLEREQRLLSRDRGRLIWLIVRAWNATRAGESLTKLQLPSELGALLEIE